MVLQQSIAMNGITGCINYNFFVFSGRSIKRIFDVFFLGAMLYNFLCPKISASTKRLFNSMDAVTVQED